MKESVVWPLPGFAVTKGHAHRLRKAQALPFVNAHITLVRALFNALNHAINCAVLARAWKGGLGQQSLLLVICDKHNNDCSRRS